MRNNYHDCMQFLYFWLRTVGRISVSIKEKYGRVDVNSQLGWHDLHSVIYPGYHYNQFSPWLRDFDLDYIAKVMPFLNYLVVPLQRQMYRVTYRVALYRWPELRGPLLDGADSDLLSPGFGIHRVRTGPRSHTIYRDWLPGDKEDI